MTFPHDNGVDIQADFTRLITNSAFHDVTLVCSDGVEIGACRAVLATRSVVLERILYSDPTCSRVVLRDIKSPALRIVLAFIHTDIIGTAPLSAWTAVEAYHAASVLLLPKLMGMILERAEVDDIKAASSLLNEAVASLQKDESTTALFHVLTRSFRKHELVVGDLDELSEDALETLLTYTTDDNELAFTTTEESFLLCVIGWAWTRADNPPPLDERRAQLNTLRTTSVNSMDVPKIRIQDDRSHASLQRMMPHMDLVLVCPHRLKLIMEAVDVLTDTSSHHKAFSHYACLNTTCLPGHPSRSRGGKRPRDDVVRYRWEAPDPVIVSDDGAVVKFALSPGLRWDYRTARIVPACTAASGGLRKWDILVESVGINTTNESLLQVGLVGENFNLGSYMNSGGARWGFQSYKSISTLFNGVSGGNIARRVASGDVLTFHLNMDDRTCALSINGQSYGVAWCNLPEKVHPAVTVSPKTKLRFRQGG